MGEGKGREEIPQLPMLDGNDKQNRALEVITIQPKSQRIIFL